MTRGNKSFRLEIKVSDRAELYIKYENKNVGKIQIIWDIDIKKGIFVANIDTEYYSTIPIVFKMDFQLNFLK